jgi:hypothetical protein
MPGLYAARESLAVTRRQGLAVWFYPTDWRQCRRAGGAAECFAAIGVGEVARVNIEDSIYKDLRFIRLAMALGGDVDRAIGALVRAWSLAQEWYLKTPDRMIPLAEWRAKEINQAVIDVGLAELVGDRVRIRGADEQFKWLLAASKNGKKAHTEIIEEPARPQPATGGDRRLPSTSSSSSFSSSPSSSSSDSLYLFSKGESASADHAVTNPEIKSPVGYFIANYVNAYQARYGWTQGQVSPGRSRGR